MKMKKELIKIGIKVLKKSSPLIIEIGSETLIKLVKYGADKIGSITYDKKSKEVMIYSYDDVIDIEDYSDANNMEKNCSEDDIMKCIDEFNDNFKSDDSGKITQFRGEYFFLSSFYICRINYKGIIYNTAEAAFQSMKSKDIGERKEFVYLTPKEVKIKGNKVSLREDWEDIKEAVMYNICLCKFSQNDDLAKRLMETGDAYLEQESSWNDKEWGTVDGVGENKLGKILMKVREEIKKDI